MYSENSLRRLNNVYSSRHIVHFKLFEDLLWAPKPKDTIFLMVLSFIDPKYCIVLM